jgi:hypothetical protein
MGGTTLSEDQFLYRIISFDRLVQMIERDEWYFAHPSSWDDPYETHVTNEFSKALFAQCWCRKGVSDAMWRIYSQDKLGVRIRTTKEKLTLALLKASRTTEIGFHIGNVKYLNPLEYVSEAERVQAEARKKITFLRACAHLWLKRRAFDHEAETRAVVFDPARLAKPAARGIVIPVDTRNVLDSVLVDPRAPEAFVSAYQHYLSERLGFKKPVKRSQLYRVAGKHEA